MSRENIAAAEALLLSEKQRAAVKLSGLLAKLPFDPALKTALAAVPLESFFEEASVVLAMQEIEKRDQYFILGILRLWWRQKYFFTSMQKSVLVFSVMILMANLVFTRELFILLGAKDKIEKTGTVGVASVCTQGLNSQFLQLCGAQAPNTTSVFDFANLILGPNGVEPNFQGCVVDPQHGPIPGAGLEKIGSWLLPTGYEQFFTCTRNPDDSTEFNGHSFIGTLSDALNRAKNAFPVASTTIPWTDNPISNLVAFQVMMTLFFANFCIQIQNGGYSAITNAGGYPYGHFDGFESSAKEFGLNARIFGAVYGGLGLLAFMAVAVLALSKVFSKWSDASDKRDEFFVVKSACALYRSYSAKTPPGHTAITMGNIQ